MNIETIDRILNDLRTNISIVAIEDEKMLLNYINYLKSNNERQADMLRKIFNIIYNDDKSEMKVMKIRDVLMGEIK